jgi:hypothetical protein
MLRFYRSLNRLQVVSLWCGLLSVGVAAIEVVSLVNKLAHQGTVDRATWAHIDDSVVQAMQRARKTTERAAEQEVDSWLSEVMQRADSFLDGYFGYFNQSWLGIKGLFTGTENVTRQVQQEFLSSVIRPEESQKRIQTIATGLVKTYLAEMPSELRAIPVTFQIPETEWRTYLESLSVTAHSYFWRESNPVSLQSVVGEKLLRATVEVGVARDVRAFEERELRSSARMTETAIARVASKTSGKVIGRAAGKVLGAVFFAWDIWDHWQTVATYKPMLRQEIAESLARLRGSVLEDRQRGVMAAVLAVEDNIRESIRRRNGTREKWVLTGCVCIILGSAWYLSATTVRRRRLTS